MASNHCSANSWKGCRHLCCLECKIEIFTAFKVTAIYYGHSLPSVALVGEHCSSVMVGNFRSHSQSISTCISPWSLHCPRGQNTATGRRRWSVSSLCIHLGEVASFPGVFGCVGHYLTIVFLTNIYPHVHVANNSNMSETLEALWSTVF